MPQDPTFLHLVGLPYWSSRPMQWAHHPQYPRPAPWAPAVHGSNPGYYACRVATSLWPRACIVRPKLSIKGAVFAPAVGQVPAVEPRGSVSGFLVGYATLVTSCDSPPGLHRTRCPHWTNQMPYSLSLFIMFVLSTVYVGAAV